MWEDGYLSSVSQVADYCQSQEVLVQGSIDYGLLQASYSKLSYQIYNVGEGSVLPHEILILLKVKPC